MTKVEKLIMELKKMNEPEEKEGVIGFSHKRLFLTSEKFTDLINDYDIKRRSTQSYPIKFKKEVAGYYIFSIASVLEAINHINKHQLLNILPKLSEYLKEENKND